MRWAGTSMGTSCPSCSLWPHDADGLQDKGDLPLLQQGPRWLSQPQGWGRGPLQGHHREGFHVGIAGADIVAEISADCGVCRQKIERLGSVVIGKYLFILSKGLLINNFVLATGFIFLKNFFRKSIRPNRW